jgi:hypothetical protein
MLYYEKSEYVVDGTLAINTWTDEDGYLEPYGDVTVNLSAYGMTPPPGTIFMPKYKMPQDYFDNVCEDIVDNIIKEIPIGYGTGVMAKLKPDWENNVNMLTWEE